MADWLVELMAGMMVEMWVVMTVEWLDKMLAVWWVVELGNYLVVLLADKKDESMVVW